MPSVWDINSSYNVSNKKVSSKLTFKVGEKFNGRVVGKISDSEVVIKLSDGWQFTAEVEGDIDLLEEGNIRFQVEGYKDGKLKLKIVKDNSEKQSLIEDNILSVIEKEGLGKDKGALLKEMVKYNIPLTRENIDLVKSIVNFNEEINDNSQEINKFIKSYLKSNGIESKSDIGLNIKNELKGFFKEFKNMSAKEILFFIENDIEFNKENIQSYNKIFKGNDTTYNLIKDLGSNLKYEGMEIKDLREYIRDTNLNDKLLDNRIQEKNNMTSSLPKAYGSASKGKLSMLSLLKSMVGAENEILKEPLKTILEERSYLFTSKEYNEVVGAINNANDESLIEKVVSNLEFDSIENLNKEKLEEGLKSIWNKDIKLTEKEFDRIKDILVFKGKGIPLKGEGDILGSSNGIATDKLSENNVDNKQSIINLSVRDEIKADIKGKLTDIKAIVKELGKSLETSGTIGEKVLSLIKGNLNDIKLINTVNNNYYYIDVPIKRFEDEYPCKLIIKDNRKDGKKIDKTNVKLVVTINTINLGSVDGYIKLRDNNIDIDLKCNEEFVKLLDKGSALLVEKIREIGYDVNVIVSKKVDESNLADCREFFNDNNVQAIDIMV